MGWDTIFRFWPILYAFDANIKENPWKNRFFVKFGNLTGKWVYFWIKSLHRRLKMENTPWDDLRIQTKIHQKVSEYNDFLKSAPHSWKHFKCCFLPKKQGPGTWTISLTLDLLISGRINRFNSKHCPVLKRVKNWILSLEQKHS